MSNSFNINRNRSPSVDDGNLLDQPLDAFTQELVRENELLIADLDQLRENEDRLIDQINSLQSELANRDNAFTREIQQLRQQLDDHAKAQQEAAEAHAAEVNILREDLSTARHTLSLIEESSQQHHEQMEQMESELEEARAEIEQLSNAASEAITSVNDLTHKHALHTSEAVDKAVGSTLSELNKSIKFSQATIQSIFKSIKGSMLFSVYGDPLTPFEEQPTPTLHLSENDIFLKENELGKIHKKITDTVRRIEGFSSLGDARCAELKIPPSDHPFRPFVSASLEACLLLVTLHTALSKVALAAARNKYSFSDGGDQWVNVSGSAAPMVGGGSSAMGGGSGGGPSAVALSGTAASTSTAAMTEAPPSKATTRGLGLWAR